MATAHTLFPQREEDGRERVPPVGVKFHPLADLFPWLEGASFDELKADIARNGVLEPIVFIGDEILDGRNRYMAARDLGMEYPRTEYRGTDPQGFVIAKNLARRHLSESQRAMVAARLAKMPPHRPSESAPIEALSQPQAADLLNVGRSAVQRATTVQRDAVPELVAAVERGEVSVSAAAEVARLPAEDQSAIVEHGAPAVREAAKEIRETGIVNRTSFTGNNEWFTPPEHIERVRAFLGAIDLDPASNPLAQEKVRAERFFTETDSGLDAEWSGRVWLNPPYAQPAISQFIDKMVEEVAAGRVAEAVMLTHNYTDTGWFQKAARAARAICFTKGRIRFVSPSGELAAPTQGQAFFYFGDRFEAFAAAYADVGFVVELHQ